MIIVQTASDSRSAMPIKTQQRMNHFGIEVANNITWQGWEPGGEYTKDITLKNVQIKTQKLKYRCQFISDLKNVTKNLPVTSK